MDNSKLILDRKEGGTVTFNFNHLYTIDDVIKKISAQINDTPGDYIIFDCDTYSDSNEVDMVIISGRDETDDEFDERMLREKWQADNLISRQYKADYIQYLSLKAKFEKK